MGSIMINRVFAYGTLNLDTVQRYLWGEAKRGVVAQLDDYKLHSYDSNIFYLKKEFGETVAGKIYELTNEQLKRTDMYEGSAYKKDYVMIDGVSVTVYVQSKG